MNDWYYMIDLQRFAEGGAGDGGAGAGDAGAAGAAQTGVTEADAAPQSRRRAKSNPLANVRFGIDPSAPTAQQANTAADAAQQESAPRMTFDELLKSDPQYKADYDAKVRKAINGRFAERRQMEGQLNKMQPIIDAIGAHYGFDMANPAGVDLDGLLSAINNDRKLYEDEAVREGVPVEHLMQRKQLERQQAAFDAQQRRVNEEAAARQEMTELLTAATALKQTIPDFDIDAEMQNPAFARMVAPGTGIMSVEDAYKAIHRKEIEAAQSQVIAQQTAQKISNAIQAGSRRPDENGTSGQSASVTTFDYSRASKEQRDALKREIYAAKARGEKLYPGMR